MVNSSSLPLLSRAAFASAVGAGEGDWLGHHRFIASSDDVVEEADEYEPNAEEVDATTTPAASVFVWINSLQWTLECEGFSEECNSSLDRCEGTTTA